MCNSQSSLGVSTELFDQVLINFWQERCQVKLTELIVLYYQKTKILLPEPKIVFDIRSDRLAGQAVYPKTIRLNLAFLMQERDHYVDNVVGHELAHYIIFHKLKNGILKGKLAPHGKEWKQEMELLEIPSNVYHSYCLENTKKEKFPYKCSCPNGRIHYLSKIRHTRSQKQNTSYLCNTCKTKLIYLGDKKSAIK